MSQAEISRKKFLELSAGSLAACFFTSRQETPHSPEPDYQILNGGCLIANHHEFLFTNELFRDQLIYYQIMGVKVIRAFATDANKLTCPSCSGAEVGSRIAQTAPALRETGIKLLIPLTNNHCPVPGDGKYAGVQPQIGDPNRVYYEIMEPWFDGGFRENYFPFVMDLINTLKQKKALDVVFAWEPGNELHTPYHPEKLLAFYEETIAFIKDLDQETPIASGTMGVNHLAPFSPFCQTCQEIYTLEGFDFLTLHTYDLILEWSDQTNNFDRVINNGDMPIQWDFELIRRLGLEKPIIIEEIGTSRSLPPFWNEGDELKKLVSETRMIDFALRNGAVGWGPWSLTTQGERIGDGYRGPNSYPGTSLFQSEGILTDSPRARIEEAYRSLPQASLSTLREKFPNLGV
jgi:endo-1,4-beta-mannosidase